MKRTKRWVGGMAFAAGTAMAGGIERTDQSIGFLFEEGRVLELGYSSVSPSVKSSPDAYGKVVKRYNTPSLALKMDLNEQVSLGLGLDSPYGAEIEYPVPLDTGAKLESSAITALGRYRFSPNLSVHGGVYRVSMDGEYNPPPPSPLPTGSKITVGSSSDIGQIVGAAYEKPEIAARLALTFYSGTTHQDAASASRVKVPRAVNVDVQTGIAAQTLLFGGMRWVDWTQSVFELGGAPLVSYRKDTRTYHLGLGRKLSENFSASVTLAYETGQGGTVSPLMPVDGYRSLGLGGTYTRGKLRISAGVRSVDLRDATTAGLPVNSFKGNSTKAAGVKLLYSF